MRWMPGDTIASLEKMAILDAMKFYEGRKTDVSEALGISLKTLYNKLDEYAKEDILREEKEAEDKLKRENWIREQRGLSPIVKIGPEIDTIDDFAVSLPKRPAVVVEPLQTEEPQKAAGGRRGR